MAGFDEFEREVRPYHTITGKHIDEDTTCGAILGALAKAHRDLFNHLVLNAYPPLLSKQDTRGNPGDPWYQEVNEPEGKGGKGKKGKKGDSKGQIAIKFVGSC